MKKINNIKIKNFKSLRNVEINDCRRVNVFIGYPNVGKSNILEGIGLYSLYNNFLALNSILSKQKVSSAENITSLKDLVRIEEASEIFYFNNNRLDISIELNDAIISSIYVAGNNFILEFKSHLDDNGAHKEGEKIEIDVQDLTLKKIDVHGLSNNKLPNISIKKYDFSQRHHTKSNSYSELTYPFGENLLNVLERDTNLRKDVAEYFKEYGFRLALEKSSQKIVMIKDMGDDTISIIPYYQMADTLRRLVFFKAAIYSNENSVLLFEEPEAHMFPPYISKFTSDVVHDKNNNQFFISTHSPFVLNDFMEDLDKEELAIYAVGYKQETGETVVHRMSSDEMDEIYQYGIDLFFNLENYLKDAV